MIVFKQPGTNVVQVVDGIKTILPRLQAALPPSVNMYILFDRSITIRNSVNDVKFTLELALFLVIMGHLPVFAELVSNDDSEPSAPILACGHVCGDVCLPLFARQPFPDGPNALGRLRVDDAIVMLENIVRHMEHGESAMEAAINGSGEIVLQSWQ